MRLNAHAESGILDIAEAIRPAVSASRLRKAGLTRALVAGGAAAVVAASAVPMTANAAIISSGIVNLSATIPASAGTVSTNVSVGGTNQFALTAFNSKGTLGIELVTPSATPTPAFSFLTTTAQGTTLTELGNSYSVDASGTYSNGNTLNGSGQHGTVVYVNTALGGQFAAGADAYFGFSFNPTGSQVDFGWSELTISADGKTVTLVQDSYDDSGAAILTPAAAVPEPSMAVAGLLGTAGMSLRRRRSRVVAR